MIISALNYYKLQIEIAIYLGTFVTHIHRLNVFPFYWFINPNKELSALLFLFPSVFQFGGTYVPYHDEKSPLLLDSKL